MKRGARLRCGYAQGVAVAMLATLASAQSNDLVSAAGRGDLPTVNALLQAGADVNATQELVSFGRNSEDGATALGLAAQNGHLTVVQALLAAKADVDAGSIPALYHATAAGNLDIVKALLAAKPNLDWRDPGLGSTTLMFALAPNDSVLRNQLPREGRWDIARLLVEAGANVNVTDKGGVTALMLAVQEDGPRGLAMVQVLLAAHADVNGGCVCRTMRRRSGA